MFMPRRSLLLESLLFVFVKDKDYVKMLRMIDESGDFDTIILTNIDSERAVDSKTMRECIY